MEPLIANSVPASKSSTVPPKRPRKISRISKAPTLRGKPFRFRASTGADSGTAQIESIAQWDEYRMRKITQAPIRPEAIITSATELRGRSGPVGVPEGGADFIS